jgi:hypothetical protein
MISKFRRGNDKKLISLKTDINELQNITSNNDIINVINPVSADLNMNNNSILATQNIDTKKINNKDVQYNPSIAELNMNNFKITNLPNAVNPADAISKGQSDTLYLNVSGDLMQGNINMSNNRIINLGNPLSGTEAINRNYLEANALINPANTTLNMNNNRIINVPLALSLTDAVSVNYLQANALINPANANLNMNNFEIQEIKTLRGRNNVPLNIILGSGGSLSISGGGIFCGNARIGSVAPPLFGDDVTTKDYVDGLVGSPGKLRFINSVADLGVPLSIDGQLRYVIPNDLTYYVTSSLTITYGFSFGINTEITGNQNISITFNEAINDITGFYSRNQNTTITNLTFIYGGGNFAGFNDINNVQKGLFDCIDLTKTKRFRLLNCNFIRSRRFGIVLGYDNVNINDNVIDGGANTTTWYNSLVSTQPLFMDDYPYKVIGSNLELITNSSVSGNVGSITSVDIYKRGTNALTQQYTFIDDNGYSQEQAILVPGGATTDAKYGTYMDVSQNILAVSFQNIAGGLINLNIYNRLGNGFYQLQQAFQTPSGVVVAETPISVTSTIIAQRLYDGAKYVIFIYNLVLGTWTKVQEVTTNNINWGRYSIKVLEHPNGNAYLIVGYPGFAINGGFGAVNVYERLPGGSFVLNGTLPNPGLVLALDFGKYVSADRNMLMTSANNNTVYLTRNYAIVMGTFISSSISSPDEDKKSFGQSIDVQYNVLDGEYRMIIGDPAKIEANVISNVITTFTAGKLYVYYYRSNNASTNTNDLLLKTKTQEISVPTFYKNLNNNIGFTTGLSFTKFSEGESFVVGSTLYNNSIGNTAIYRYKDNKYFLGQFMNVIGSLSGDISGTTVLSYDDAIFIASPGHDSGVNTNQGRIARFKKGLLPAQGSVVISNAIVGEIGEFSKSGLCLQDSNTLEYNNNNTYAFSGTQDPFTTDAMLYFIAPSSGGINAVTIDGNIFSPQNLESAIDVDPTNIINLATITGNTFIRDGGFSPLIKYRDSDTINTFNHPSVQKFEIESNAGEINSTPILRHILGLSQQLQGTVWSPITYLSTEVNGIFDNSKRFAVRCQIQSTRQFQVGNYIKPNDLGKALIVYAEPITNDTYQCYWITDFTGPITSGGFNTNIQEVAYNNPTVISTGSNFRLGVLPGTINSFYEYVYIDKDPKDMLISCSLSFTGDTLNRTHVFRINFASDGINYLDDASLETYTVITRTAPEVLNITLVDSFKFVYGSKFKIEQKQNTTSSAVTIRDGIITAQ